MTARHSFPFPAGRRVAVRSDGHTSEGFDHTFHKWVSTTPDIGLPMVYGIVEGPDGMIYLVHLTDVQFEDINLPGVPVRSPAML